MSRLLIVNTVAAGAATATVARRYALAAVAAGHQVAWAYGRGREPSGDASGVLYRRIASPLECGAALAATRLAGRHGDFDLGAARRLERWMEQWSPDVVHLHNLHGYYIDSLALLRALAAAGTRTLVTLHDFWLLTGHCAFPTVRGCDRWMAGCHSCPGLRDYPVSWLADGSARAWQARRRALAALPQLTLLALSPWQERVVREALGPQADVRLMPNDVCALFREAPPEASAPERRERSVLAVANVWDSRKGLPDILEMWRRLPPGYELTVAGLSLRQRLSMPRGVRALGRLPAEALAREYRSASVLASPSRGEAAPLTVLEALCCGTPVAVYGGSGAESLLTDASQGVAVPMGDVRALAHAVEALSRRRGVEVTAPPRPPLDPYLALL